MGLIQIQENSSKSVVPILKELGYWDLAGQRYFGRFNKATTAAQT